jgi:hypothetical protein
VVSETFPDQVTYSPTPAHRVAKVHAMPRTEFAQNLLTDNLALVGMFIAEGLMVALGGDRSLMGALYANVQWREEIRPPKSVALGDFGEDRRLVHDHPSQRQRARTRMIVPAVVRSIEPLSRWVMGFLHQQI